MTFTFANKLSQVLLLSLLVFSVATAADDLDLQLTTAEGAEIMVRFPVTGENAPLVEAIETVDGYRVGIAEDDTEVEELGRPEEYISLSLPDGTVLDLALANRNRVTQEVSEEQSTSESIAVSLPSGLTVNITLNRPTYTGRETKPADPPRIGIAEDDTDEEELGDPEGIIAILPSGLQVAITTNLSRVSTFQGNTDVRKPPRIGIAEDDTDEEELGDPEGIIAVLPVDSANNRY